MKTSKIEMTWDGYVVVRWEGILDFDGWAEVQRRIDLFKEGDTKSLDACKAQFDNPLRFFSKNDRNPFRDEPCRYPLDKP